MKSKTNRASAQVRSSQMLSTYGPGSMVDLPKRAVIIGGLDHWKGPLRPIAEPRLATKVASVLERPTVDLYAPPENRQEIDAPFSGVIARVFPEWFVAQYEEERDGGIRTRPLVNRARLVRGKYQDLNRKGHSVVPIRFVQACVRGHISDIRWFDYIHRGTSSCRSNLWLDERGTSGDLSEIMARCECGQTRSLADASDQKQRALGSCRGERPWLGPKAAESCGGPDGKPQPNRLLMRTATNAYFAQVLRVISIPDTDQIVSKTVDGLWEQSLRYVESKDELVKERRREHVRQALEGLSDDVVWREIQRRKTPQPANEKPIKQVEIETLLASQDELGDDVLDSDFYARSRRLTPNRPGAAAFLSRLVLVHRLREVQALVGFTRFEAEMPDIQGELALDVRRAELALETRWVPAVENRGEGIFIALREESLQSWLSTDGAKARCEHLEAAFDRWLTMHPGSKQVFPGLPYIMLHSLSHLLITQLSLVCGYAASSIRERIYAGSAGHGILLYTGTSDAEGTLGGLVQVGREIEDHLEAALELGRLCSNDPVCALHPPAILSGDGGLMGAACHGCLLIAEPSCERRNEFLDRALVVQTVGEQGAEFFTGQGA
jgi:hypothetical protein